MSDVVLNQSGPHFVATAGICLVMFYGWPLLPPPKWRSISIVMCVILINNAVEHIRRYLSKAVLLFNEYHSFKQHRKPSKYRQKADVAVRELRKLASNRKGWATLVKDVCAAISIKGAVTVKAEAP